MKVISIILLCLVLISCSREETYFFKATVDDVYEGSYLVIVDEDDRDITSMDLLSISTDKDFNIGDRVIIEFDGVVMESYPGQINLISIELEE